MTNGREHLAPTDIICLAALAVLTFLYWRTHEMDFKQALMGMILFLAGRQSKKPDK